MRSGELLTRLLIGVLVALAAGIPIWASARTPLIHARMADNGGWTPDILRAKVGEPLHLRLTSDDVTHGFAVGQMEMQSAEIEPGKVTDLTLSFKKPGTYTFYCTRWCGINHWRMRGTIEVAGSEAPAAPPVSPLYVKLGLDIDAPHEAGAVPRSRPSALRGEQDAAPLSVSQFIQPDFQRANSPYQVWAGLRRNSSLSKLNDQRLWDLVAFIWQSNTSPLELEEGRKLFAQNCAACHGEGGGGNGVFADQLALSGSTGGANMSNATMMIQRPADFTDPKRMLGASPALLEGKILRGGMGTGMPSWGPVLTEEQIRKVIAYIYSFQFGAAGK